MNTQLEPSLNKRFLNDDAGEYLSELEDISMHGCGGGVSGFLYTHELNEFFDEHESDIEDVLNELDIRLENLVRDSTSWTFSEMKQNAVWVVVEEYAKLQVDQGIVAFV